MNSSKEALTNNSNHNENSLGANYSQMIEIIALPIMIIVGTICNILTFMVMCRHRFRHQSTGIYMAVLAIADELVLLFGCLIRWIYQFYQLNPLSTQISCRLLSVFYYSSIDFSVWMVVMMTIERYIAVTFPLQANRLCTVKRAKILTLILGSFIVLINLHFIITHSFNNNFNNNFGCQPTDNSTLYFMDNIWPWIDAAKYSFLPLITIIVFNFLIICNLIQASAARHKLTYESSQKSRSLSSTTVNTIKHTNGTTNNTSSSSNNNNRRLTTMLLVVSITFCILSSPLVILQILETHFSIRNRENEFTVDILKAIFVILQYSNHCINFFLYAITGEIFRRELCGLFVCLRRLIDKNYEPARPYTTSIRFRNNIHSPYRNDRNNQSMIYNRVKEAYKEDQPSNDTFVQTDKANALGHWCDSNESTSRLSNNNKVLISNMIESDESKL